MGFAASSIVAAAVGVASMDDAAAQQQTAFGENVSVDPATLRRLAADVVGADSDDIGSVDVEKRCHLPAGRFAKLLACEAREPDRTKLELPGRRGHHGIATGESAGERLQAGRIDDAVVGRHRGGPADLVRAGALRLHETDLVGPDLDPDEG